MDRFTLVIVSNHSGNNYTKNYEKNYGATKVVKLPFIRTYKAKKTAETPAKNLLKKPFGTNEVQLSIST
jgi:hypothetical protein